MSRGMDSSFSRSLPFTSAPAPESRKSGVSRRLELNVTEKAVSFDVPETFQSAFPVPESCISSRSGTREASLPISSPLAEPEKENPGSSERIFERVPDPVTRASCQRAESAGTVTVSPEREKPALAASRVSPFATRRSEATFPWILGALRVPDTSSSARTFPFPPKDCRPENRVDSFSSESEEAFTAMSRTGAFPRATVPLNVTGLDIQFPEPETDMSRLAAIERLADALSRTSPLNSIAADSTRPCRRSACAVPEKDTRGTSTLPFSPSSSGNRDLKVSRETFLADRFPLTAAGFFATAASIFPEKVPSPDFPESPSTFRVPPPYEKAPSAASAAKPWSCPPASFSVPPMTGSSHVPVRVMGPETVPLRSPGLPAPGQKTGTSAMSTPSRLP